MSKSIPRESFSKFTEFLQNFDELELGKRKQDCGKDLESTEAFAVHFLTYDCVLLMLEEEASFMKGC